MPFSNQPDPTPKETPTTVVISCHDESAGAVAHLAKELKLRGVIKDYRTDSWGECWVELTLNEPKLPRCPGCKAVVKRTGPFRTYECAACGKVN